LKPNDGRKVPTPTELRPSNDEAKRRRVSPIRGLGRWKNAVHKGSRRHGRLSKGVTLLLKATLPACTPNRHRLSLLQHAPKPSPMARGLGPACHADRLRAEEAKPPRVVHATAQRLQVTLHFCPDQRVAQPARRMLHASNCTATYATTAPPRLRNQYRDSRRPSARPSSASLTRRSTRPEVGRQ
jgi:hypothetical protein